MSTEAPDLKFTPTVAEERQEGVEVLKLRQEAVDARIAALGPMPANMDSQQGREFDRRVVELLREVAGDEQLGTAFEQRAQQLRAGQGSGTLSIGDRKAYEVFGHLSRLADRIGKEAVSEAAAPGALSGDGAGKKSGPVVREAGPPDQDAGIGGQPAAAESAAHGAGQAPGSGVRENGPGRNGRPDGAAARLRRSRGRSGAGGTRAGAEPSGNDQPASAEAAQPPAAEEVASSKGNHAAPAVDSDGLLQDFGSGPDLRAHQGGDAAFEDWEGLGMTGQHAGTNSADQPAAPEGELSAAEGGEPDARNYDMPQGAKRRVAEALRKARRQLTDLGALAGYDVLNRVALGVVGAAARLHNFKNAPEKRAHRRIVGGVAGVVAVGAVAYIADRFGAGHVISEAINGVPRGGAHHAAVVGHGAVSHPQVHHGPVHSPAHESAGKPEQVHLKAGDTVWSEVQERNPRLHGHKLWKAVQKVLQFNHISWGAAAHLNQGDVIQFPAGLAHAGAHTAAEASGGALHAAAHAHHAMHRGAEATIAGAGASHESGAEAVMRSTSAYLEENGMHVAASQLPNLVQRVADYNGLSAGQLEHWTGTAPLVAFPATVVMGRWIAELNHEAERQKLLTGKRKRPLLRR